MPLLDPAAAKATQLAFFNAAFGTAEGFVCIAYIVPGKRGLQEDFYRWPNQLEEMLHDIEAHGLTDNVYFCPQLLTNGKRTKEHIKTCPSLWADLDSCEPENLLVPPTITVETSPGRYQALWVFERPQEPDVAEEYSKRIAYKHADQGCDRGGWDLTQLLRVPGTYNLKYTTGLAPMVKVVSSSARRYRIKDFEDYPAVAGEEFLDIPFPTEFPDKTADDLLAEYKNKLPMHVWGLFQNIPEPGDDGRSKWSDALWKLEMMLFEAGMTREEVYIIATHAACNKYARDGRPKTLLWKDVCRAFNKNEQNINIVIPQDTKQEELLTPEEKLSVEANPTFVERFIDWASSLGDAAVQYHQAGALTALSAILCGNTVLPTSYGAVVPNLWFMILADTTLTRKTTAMDIAMDLVMEVDTDCVLATDGSIEGVLTALSARPGRPSIFLRDEFSGLLESLTKKDYMAGMAEMLTKLYDGKMQKRILRKETVEVRDPRLIVFAGGIRNRITQLLTFDHVSSGFMPRFVFITAESDVSRVRPLGPPTAANLGNRDAILNELRDIQAHYGTTHELKVEGSKVAIQVPRIWEASMSQDAWLRFNKLEDDMMRAALDTEHPELMTPTYDRLGKSILKAALLIAASQRRSDTELVIMLDDLLHAMYYGQQWREYVHQVINAVGKGTAEREFDKIYTAIQRHEGISRSLLMQYYHLSARDADGIFRTLEERGLITRAKAGRTEQFYTVKRPGQEDIPAPTRGRRIKING